MLFRSFTSGFGLYMGSASHLVYGHMMLTHFGSNTWIRSSVVTSSSGGYAFMGGGTVTLSGALDRLRLTTVNGTDTFDAGSVNVMYE